MAPLYSVSDHQRDLKKLANSLKIDSSRDRPRFNPLNPSLVDAETVITQAIQKVQVGTVQPHVRRPIRVRDSS
jgi:hypothetical protein